jgi:hypothetical protein
MTDDVAKIIHEKYKNRIICIASPSPELTDYRYNISLIELITTNIGLFELRLQKSVSSRISINRNNIVRDARSMGATDILWIDADTRFPTNGLLRLLECDKDIACATTCMRKESGIPIGAALDPTIQAKLIRMKLVGFPFMLTKLSVFDKFDELWPERKGCYFAEPPRWAFPQMGAIQDEVVGEDEYFCHYALEAGLDIWCDMELSTEIGHIGSTVYYISPENIIAPPAKVDEALGA